MEFDLAHRLKVFLASAPQNDRIIQYVEFTHPAMSRTFCFWREPYPGVVTNEAGQLVSVEPLNMEIGTSGYEGNLDSALQIRIDATDIEDAIRDELDRIPVDTTQEINVVYRQYLASNLDEPVLYGYMIAETLSMEKGVVTILAVVPRLSSTRTGELYDLRSVPMLRAML